LKTCAELGAILFLGCIIVSCSAKSVTQTHNSNWTFSFNGNFSNLYLTTGKLAGTYSVLFNEEFAKNQTNPIGRYWSPSKINRDFGFDFLSEVSEGGELRRFRSFTTPVEDELNLTMFPSWFPLDYHVTGFIVAFNVTMEFRQAFVHIDLSPDVESVWSVSYDFKKMNIDSLHSPFSEIPSTELEEVKAWNNATMYLFTLSFARREPMITRLVLTYWLPACLTTMMPAFLWIIYLKKRRTYPSLLVAVASLQATFIGMFLSSGPPIIPSVLLLLIAGVLFNVASAAAMYYLETRKPAIEEKIDEIHSFVRGVRFDSIPSTGVPTTLSETSVNEGEKVSMVDHQTGKEFSGTVIDTHLFCKVSYESEREGFFKDQMLIKLHGPAPERPVIVQNERGFPIGVIWASSQTHAVAARILGQQETD